MKHILPCITLFLMLTASTHVMGQDTYEILRIYNAESISIGNRMKKVGDTFKDISQIDFANYRQSFRAQKKGSKKIYYFNKASMEAKKSKTLKDYFANDYNKTKGSARGLSGNVPAVMQGKYDAVKFPERRIALVIGNGNYQELDILPNAINDARDVSNRLKQLGFDVITLYDGDINDMQTTVNSFFQVAQSYRVALIYFAGHGIRYEGKDYLLSVDRGNLSIKDECSLDYLVVESEKWKSNGKVMIFVIDACRDRAGFATAGDYRTIEAKKGTAILQSTSSGEVAMDADAGKGNSPFATAFINGIGQSGNDIDEDFFSIRKEVSRSTNESQTPRTSLGGGYNFCFCKSCKPQSTKIQNTSNYDDIQTQRATYTAELLEDYAKRGNEQFDKKNYEEAVRLFRIAAEGGNPVGQEGLGFCYEKGYGVPQSYTQAEKWYRLAAEQGYAKAQYNLGVCYLHGRGVVQSYSIAVKWFLLAAEQGDDWAQNNLGVCYIDGNGVSQSCTEAVKWYRMAANNGNYIAQCNLGFLYLDGRCVSKSYPEAVKWFRLSANQGFHAAQYGLGICYENGLGVTKSYTEAVKWYRLAADQGNEQAKEKLSGL